MDYQNKDEKLCAYEQNHLNWIVIDETSLNCAEQQWFDSLALQLVRYWEFASAALSVEGDCFWIKVLIDERVECELIYDSAEQKEEGNNDV